MNLLALTFSPTHQPAMVSTKAKRLGSPINKLTRSLRRSSCFILFALIIAPLRAQVPPSADTFVSNTTPFANYGASIALVVCSGTTSYIQFNLAGIPANATVAKATLRLYVDAVGKAGSFDVYELHNSWSENKLTFNSPPPVLGMSATGGKPIAITTSSLNQFILIDVTTLVQEWLNGSLQNNGVALALTTAGGSFSFDSKESLLTANGPELEVVLGGAGGSGPPGPQGLTGPQGPSGPPGTQGSVGPAGPAGPKGDTGVPGAVGSQGPAGPVGPSGTANLANFTCPTGQSIIGFNSASQPLCSGSAGGGGGTTIMDSDGDGIPDTLDQCPQIANKSFNGSSYCPASIYDVNKGASLPGALLVLANAQVIFSSTTQMTLAVMPTDPGYQGADHGSLTINLGSIPPPAAGSRINAFGMQMPGLTFSLAGVELISSEQLPLVLSSLMPAAQSVSVGGQLAITATINAPAPVDTSIEVVSLSNSNSITVPGSFVVPAGQSSTTFMATGLAQGSATITALLNGVQLVTQIQVTP